MHLYLTVYIHTHTIHKWAITSWEEDGNVNPHTAQRDHLPRPRIAEVEG